MFENIGKCIVYDMEQMLEVLENFDFTTLVPDETEFEDPEEIVDPEEDEDYEDLVPFEAEFNAEDDFNLRSLEALSVLHLLRRLFGEFWWKNETAALVDLLRDKFTVSEATEDRISALRVLHSTDHFWWDWRVFNCVCQGLRGLGTDFIYTPLLAAPRLVGPLMTANLVVRLQNTVAGYSPEIKSYMAVCCLESGHWAVPYPLDIAQKRIEELCEQRSLNIPLAEVLLRAKDEDLKGASSLVDLQVRQYLFLQDYYKYKVQKVEEEIKALEEKLK